MNVYYDNFSKYRDYVTNFDGDSYIDVVDDVQKLIIPKVGDDDEKHAIVMHGFSGNGKSTWIRNFCLEHPDYIVLSMDTVVRKKQAELGRRIMDEASRVFGVRITDENVALIRNHSTYKQVEAYVRSFHVQERASANYDEQRLVLGTSIGVEKGIVVGSGEKQSGYGGKKMWFMEIVEYSDKYLEDVKDLLVELEEYIVSIDKDELDQLHPEYRDKMAILDLAEVREWNGKCFLAIENDKAIGLIMGIIPGYDEFDYLDYKCPKRGEITELVVSKNIRSKGIGRELMKVMEDYFKENNCEYVLVDVFGYNDKAINFYEKSGYHTRMLVDIKKL